MYELKVSVKKVMGGCTADPPMKPGDYFTVSDGDLQIPEGGYICLWALQSLMPLLALKERDVSEETDEDWVWRVQHAQCPDPKGRVIFKIERTRKLEKKAQAPVQPEALCDDAEEMETGSSPEGLQKLRISVQPAKGHCTSRMQPGASFFLSGGRLYVPPGCHVCLYSLQAALPLLPAKQRALQNGDWMKEECEVLCPDPAGNVILRIEPME